jgi:signal transduction histidine kinase
MDFMKGSSGRLALAVAIPLLVVPLAALAWLAARSVDQQEIAMRSRLRESLLLEVAQTNARIGAWFDGLPDSLGAGAPRAGTAGRPTARELAAWKERDPLVGIPFLLDASGSIVYPAANAVSGKPGDVADGETRKFNWRYMNVFSNAEPIPVYRNIAAEYESSIVEPSPGEAPPVAGKEEGPAIQADERALALAAESSPPAAAEAKDSPEAAEEAAPPKRSGESLFGRSAKKAARSAEPLPSGAADAEPRSSVKSAPPAKDDAATVRSKVAQSIFDTDTAVQRQVYELAAEEGKEPLKRKVNPQIDAVNTRDSAPARSVYIESSKYFRDLVSRSDRGLVPRIFDNSFVLLYWEKRGDWIVGCELDMDAVRSAIAARGGSPADGLRYLAILDQAGEPLIPVPGVEGAAWRTPLVSGEISEYLPYWETAIILADPSAFENRVRASRWALSALVLVLFVSVATGGVVLWRYSANRLLEARRRTGFVTTVSHELKTPLTSIRMYSEMLAEGADLDREKRDRYLARIVGESGRLSKLIGDVLDVAKLERGRVKVTRAPVDLARLARETVEGVAERLRLAGFSVFVDVPETPVVALADADAVVRVILNLVSNAEKYSRDVRDIAVAVTADTTRGVCLVSVADRGIGVPRAHRSKIFREFHRVDASITSGVGGTGLGLSIARSLARALGGDVRYAPRERVDGQSGSVFTLSLPLAAGKEINR